MIFFISLCVSFDFWPEPCGSLGLSLGFPPALHNLWKGAVEALSFSWNYRLSCILSFFPVPGANHLLNWITGAARNTNSGPPSVFFLCNLSSKPTRTFVYFLFFFLPPLPPSFPSFLFISFLSFLVDRQAGEQPINTGNLVPNITSMNLPSNFSTQFPIRKTHMACMHAHIYTHTQLT